MGKIVGHVRVMLKLMSPTIALLHCHEKNERMGSLGRASGRIDADEVAQTKAETSTTSSFRPT